MNVLDLFSGIGGFSLGLEAAGMRTVAFCEIEPFCRGVLRRHWPDVPIFEDVRALDGRSFQDTVDLICGGYPCQPFSMAGRRRGAEDERHLWPEMYRLVREIKPRWIVAENVYGHISLGFDEVAASLEAEGFTVWSFVVPACAVGAPHRRDRVWIVAHAKGTRKHRKTGDLPQAENGQNGAVPEQLIFANHLADPGQQQRDGWRDGSRWWQREPQETLRDARLRGRKEAWVSIPESLLGRVVDGLPHRLDRLRTLGNAVVPRIPHLIGQAILRYEREVMA